MQRREINIQPRYERGLPNSDWHTDIEGELDEGEAWMGGRTEERENRQEMGCEDVKGLCVVTGNALKMCNKEPQSSQRRKV